MEIKIYNLYNLDTYIFLGSIVSKNFIHYDLCSCMHIISINGAKYLLTLLMTK